MKAMKRFIRTSVIALAMMTVTVNAFAFSFINPYGFNLPLEDFAENADRYKNDVNIIANHTASYEDGALKLTSNGTGISAYYFGGLEFNGTKNTVADAGGKQINRLTYSLAKSEHYDGLSQTGDTYDCNTFVYANGSWQNFRFKGEAAGADSYSAHINWSGGGSPLVISNLKYDEYYTVIVEADVINQCASMRLEDGSGEILGAKYAEGVTAVRNGFRFRSEADYDFKIKEASSYREAYLLKNFELKQDGGTLKASADIASDCTQRSMFGDMPKAPLVIIGQFDSEDRLLGYDIKTADIPQKAVSAQENEYTSVAASVEKHRDFDHAKAMVVTDSENFLAMCGALTAGNQ